MENVRPNTEPSLLQSVDFRAFFETLRIRWWVVPAVVAASVGFLQAQDSDLRTNPASYVVSRGYEVASPYRSLQAISLNLTVVEFPEPTTQLLILRSNEVQEEISTKLGKEIEVQIPENWETPVTFTCNQPEVSDCERAIDAYIDKATELRKEAVATGLNNLKAVLVDLQAAKPDPLVADQIAALEALSGNIEIPFALVDSFEQSIGPTVNEVRRPTYLMGIAAGLLIAFLILLQLTVSDSRVRSVRQLVRLTGSGAYLGLFNAKANPVRDRRIALGLHHELNQAKAGRVRFLPLRRALQDESLVARLASMAGATHRPSQPFSDLSVPEIADLVAGEVDVIVVQRNRDLRKDVLEAVAALQRSDRRFAGVLLID
jgi:hypothetical protein